MQARANRSAGQKETPQCKKGVKALWGQFIWAQRLCFTIEKMKEAVQIVVLSAKRRGYKRAELDRVWGKFLVQWWKAEAGMVQEDVCVFSEEGEG